MVHMRVGLLEAYTILSSAQDNDSNLNTGVKCYRVTFIIFEGEKEEEEEERGEEKEKEVEKSVQEVCTSFFVYGKCHVLISCQYTLCFLVTNECTLETNNYNATQFTYGSNFIYKVLVCQRYLSNARDAIDGRNVVL